MRLQYTRLTLPARSARRPICAGDPVCSIAAPDECSPPPAIYRRFSPAYRYGGWSRDTDSGISVRSGLLLFLALGEQLVELPLVGVIVQVIVELVARLHGVEHVFLRAVLADRLKDLERGGIHRAKRRQRVQHQHP